VLLRRTRAGGRFQNAKECWRQVLSGLGPFQKYDGGNGFAFGGGVVAPLAVLVVGSFLPPQPHPNGVSSHRVRTGDG